MLLPNQFVGVKQLFLFFVKVRQPDIGIDSDDDISCSGVRKGLLQTSLDIEQNSSLQGNAMGITTCV